MKQLIKKIPPIARLLNERNSLCDELVALKKQSAFEHGHFYSPIPSEQDISDRFQELEDRSPTELAGIDLRVEEQKHWCDLLSEHYDKIPFPDDASPDTRYYFHNPVFCASDAIALFGMMNQLRSSRIVEIGSGFSSAVMLDTNEKFLDSSCQLTFIEPYPERLYTLLRNSDNDRSRVIEKRVQDVQDAPWSDLVAGDILFIDSSHVSKCGSDVNRIYFEIVPSLNPGVVVHVHDVFPHFEYPEDWLRRGRFWNEDYLLRAFLQFNSQFEILMWVPLMMEIHREFFETKMPKCCENSGGSLWLRRIEN
ncbi:MAG: class I SAM-dependent methyltransferase [Planctomycetota bacterium]